MYDSKYNIRKCLFSTYFKSYHGCCFRSKTLLTFRYTDRIHKIYVCIVSIATYFIILSIELINVREKQKKI